MAREKLSLDRGWKFHEDQGLENLETLNHNFVYHKTKAERGRGPADPAFYDRDWETVDLPHDYVIDHAPSMNVPAAHGFLPRTNAWYRRVFRLNPEDRKKRISLIFDGVSTNAVVWVNGHLMIRNFCGYTSFSVDISDVVNTDHRLNVISVYVDTKDYEGWWYEGGGIYRHVWLLKTDEVAVATWGTFAHSKPENGVNGRWSLEAEARILNNTFVEQEVHARLELIDQGGKVCAKQEQTVQIPLREESLAEFQIYMDAPRLWSVDSPNLYTLRYTVFRDNEAADCYETRHGFRSIRFDSEQGLFLNEQPVKIKGICCHEDYANLGVAVPDELRRERMKRLKWMGANAYRCSHNPPTPEILDYCDEIGMMVMDENRWFDSAPEGLRQLKSMILRDRNHPCIILWSVANEEPLQGCPRGKRIMNVMTAYAKKLDQSRPYMLAMHTGLMEDAVTGASDVIGINYNMTMYDQIHAKHPEKPLLISEIGGSIDDMRTMGDGSGYDWSLVDTRPFLAGMFKWAGFMYRGETRGWPKLYSRSGIIEATAQPKEDTWYYKAMWDAQTDFIKLYPIHWNWPELVGDKVHVRAYTGCDEVALFLNGKLIERKSVEKYERTCFDVIYEPGILEAVAYRNGEEAARDRIETTKPAKRITLRTETLNLPADGKSVFVVWAGAEDEKGRAVLWAKDKIRFHISGEVKMLGTQSTDIYDAVSPKSMERNLYEGSCNLVARVGAVPGEVKICAEAQGFAPAEINIKLTPCQRPPHVPLEIEVDSLTDFAKME